MNKFESEYLQKILSKHITELTSLDIVYLKARRDYIPEEIRDEYNNILNGEVAEEALKTEKPKQAPKKRGRKPKQAQ